MEHDVLDLHFFRRSAFSSGWNKIITTHSNSTENYVLKLIYWVNKMVKPNQRNKKYQNLQKFVKEAIFGYKR